MTPVSENLRVKLISKLILIKKILNEVTLRIADSQSFSKLNCKLQTLYLI